MRLAYFSPLPPSKSGIADYSVELLPWLSLGAEISVFVEESAQRPATDQTVTRYMRHQPLMR